MGDINRRSERANVIFTQYRSREVFGATTNDRNVGQGGNCDVSSFSNLHFACHYWEPVLNVKILWTTKFTIHEEYYVYYQRCLISLFGYYLHLSFYTETCQIHNPFSQITNINNSTVSTIAYCMSPLHSNKAGSTPVHTTRLREPFLMGLLPKMTLSFILLPW